jgi:hypothetical protein
MSQREAAHLFGVSERATPSRKKGEATMSEEFKRRLQEIADAAYAAKQKSEAAESNTQAAAADWNARIAPLIIEKVKDANLIPTGIHLATKAGVHSRVLGSMPEELPGIAITASRSSEKPSVARQLAGASAEDLTSIQIGVGTDGRIGIETATNCRLSPREPSLPEQFAEKQIEDVIIEFIKAALTTLG